MICLGLAKCVRYNWVDYVLNMICDQKSGKNLVVLNWIITEFVLTEFHCITPYWVIYLHTHVLSNNKSVCSYRNEHKNHNTTEF
jgi:hypothetical protein